MKNLLLILSIAGVAYGATTFRSWKEDDLKVLSSLLAVNARPFLDISHALDKVSMSKNGPTIDVIEDPQTNYGYDKDLDWQCLWDNWEALYECTNETSEKERTLCLVKITIQCQKIN